MRVAVAALWAMGCGRVGFDTVGVGAADGSVTGCQAHPAQLVSDAAANSVALLWNGDGYLVAWIDGIGQGPYPVYTRRLDRWGVPIADPVTAATNGVVGYTCTYFVALAPTADGVAMAYCAGPIGKFQAFVNHLAVDGAQIGLDGKLTNNNVDQIAIHAADAGGPIAIAYETFRGIGSDNSVDFGFVDPAMLAFTTAPVRLSQAPSSSGGPAIVRNGSTLAIAWEESLTSLDFVVLDLAGQPLAAVTSVPIASDGQAPGLAALGSGFVAGKDTSLVVFDASGSVVATPTIQMAKAAAIASDDARVVVAGLDAQQEALLLEVLDAATYTALGPPAVVASIPFNLPALVTTPDGFGIAWVDSNHVVEVMTLCP